MNETTDKETLERLRKEAALPMIAARVRRSRLTLGLSHDQLTAAMGVNDNGEPIYRQTLIAWEKGRNRPQLDMLERLAAATGRDVRWFIDPALDESPFQAGEEAA